MTSLMCHHAWNAALESVREEREAAAEVVETAWPYRLAKDLPQFNDEKGIELVTNLGKLRSMTKAIKRYRAAKDSR